MKILIVSQYFWPENFQINHLVLGLKEKGHRITVLTGIPNYPGGRFYPGYGIFKRTHEDYQGIEIVRVPLVPRGKGGGIRLALNFLSFAFFASLLAPLRRLGAFDLIFVYEPSPITVGLPALVLKKLKSAPIIFWVQDLWPESISAAGGIKSRFIYKQTEKLVRYIYGRCDLILVQSKAFVNSIVRLGIADGIIRYFPNSAEDFYRPVERPTDEFINGLLPEGFLVMFAGNIGVAQDFDTMLDAVEILRDYKDIHWIILGDGRMNTHLKKQVSERRLDGNVHLMGKYPAKAMPYFFAVADVLFVSLKKNPIFALTVPAKLQSYFACARPVIAALDGEGARIVEESKAGYACPSENPKALSEAVVKMYLLTEEERKGMGMRGRQYFDCHFEQKKLLDDLETWAKLLVGK
jgi:glycosyltransferase involved in cell wall biosynthesis